MKNGPRDIVSSLPVSSAGAYAFTGSISPQPVTGWSSNATVVTAGSRSANPL